MAVFVVERCLGTHGGVPSRIAVAWERVRLARWLRRPRRDELFSQCLLPIRVRCDGRLSGEAPKNACEAHALPRIWAPRPD